MLNSYYVNNGLRFLRYLANPDEFCTNTSNTHLTILNYFMGHVILYHVKSLRNKGCTINHEKRSERKWNFYSAFNSKFIFHLKCV